MTQFAVAQKHLGSGREQKTDGLWKHVGTVDSGFIRVRNTIIPLVGSGSGLELQYDTAGRVGYVVTYDRDASTYLDLNIAGKNIILAPQQGGTLSLPNGSVTTAAILANNVQAQLGGYLGIPGFSSTVTSAWLVTPISVQITTAGGLLRVEASTPIYHTVAAAGFYIGFMLDGAIQNSLAYYISPGSSYTVNFGMTWYIQPPAGVHTVALCVYNGTPGTLVTNSAAVSTLYVTEQKR